MGPFVLEWSLDSDRSRSEGDAWETSHMPNLHDTARATDQIHNKVFFVIRVAPREAIVINIYREPK
jgi:hypothetical protein